MCKNKIVVGCNFNGGEIDEYNRGRQGNFKFGTKKNKSYVRQGSANFGKSNYVK